MEEKKATTTTAVAVKEKTIADAVLGRLRELQASGAVKVPPNYSPENALRLAWLILQETKDRNEKPVLEACTKESIATALLKMTVLGLNPAKKQCHFIPYGNKLNCQRSYFGEVLALKRALGKRLIGEPKAAVVRKGEVFRYHYQDGEVMIDEHTPSLETADNDIVAAYCIIDYLDLAGERHRHIELMTAEQIEKAWRQSRQNPFSETNGESLVAKLKGSTVHAKFPDQMAKRTVLARASKLIVNSADDTDLYLDDEDTITVPALSSLPAEQRGGEEMPVIEAPTNEKDELPEPKMEEAPAPEPAPEPQEQPPTDSLFTPKRRSRYSSGV